MRKSTWGVAAVAATSALLLAACGGSSSGTASTAASASGSASASASESAASPSATACASLTPVKLQLQWVAQAQFAGYYAAKDQGLWEKECLDVTIVEGAVDIVPQTQLATGAVDFAIAWVPKALASRQEGAGITDIGQIYQRSGTLQISLKANNDITKPEQLSGKKVGSWGYGNEFELLAGLTKAGVTNPGPKDLIQQQFDESALLAGQIDAAQAMTYNEYAQVLETMNPKTGKLYTPEEIGVINWNDVGTAMLQDSIWANTEKLTSDPAYQDTSVRLLKGAMAGWAYCRDNFQPCVDIVLKAGPTLGKSHQEWQLNEVNKLIWPSPGGIGLVQEADWARTVAVATSTGLLKAEPEKGAYDNTYAQKALDQLKAEGADVNGTSFAPQTVVLAEGGK